MKKIIVTGCNGQLGRAINQMYKNRTDIEIVNTDVKELDITDIDKTLALVREVKPYAVINCAAHTGVDACETEVDSAYRINAIGPRNISIATRETGAKFMHISTDYVFAGDASTPYTEFDKPDPQGMYGKTKLAGECFVEQFAENYFIVRTAWLYGDGKNFVRTMLRLSETRDEVGVVKDQFGSPTSAAELARIIDALIWTENYGLFHGTCEGICSWADFAEEIFMLAGKNTRVKRITTEEFNAPAKRPAYSVLDNYMLKLTCGYVAADWQKAIAEYMKNEMEKGSV